MGIPMQSTFKVRLHTLYTQAQSICNDIQLAVKRYRQVQEEEARRVGNADIIYIAASDSTSKPHGQQNKSAMTKSKRHLCHMPGPNLRCDQVSGTIHCYSGNATASSLQALIFRAHLREAENSHVNSLTLKETPCKLFS